MACIVARDGAETAEMADSIMDWALQQVAYFKAPGWIVFLDALPTTVSHKLEKGKIFAKDEDPCAHPLCFDLRDRKTRKAE